jgi:hypothetical protein
MAIARPIPLPAPVTITTLPFNILELLIHYSKQGATYVGLHQKKNLPGAMR